MSIILGFERLDVSKVRGGDAEAHLLMVGADELEDSLTIATYVS